MATLSIDRSASGWKWNIYLTHAIEEEIRLVFRILLLGITAAHHGVAISASAAAIACKQEKRFSYVIVAKRLKEKKKRNFIFSSFREGIMDRKIILGTKCIRKKKIYKYNVEYNIEEKKKNRRF